MTRGVDIEGRGVRVNGRSVGVGSVIPDSALDQFTAAGYDAAAGEWVGEQGNITLTGSGPTLQTDALNGRDVVGFDGDDVIDTGGVSESQPLTVFAAVQHTRDATGFGHYFDSQQGSSNRVGLSADESNDSWSAFAGGGNNISDGSNDYTSFYIVTTVVDGANSVLRVNGSEVGSADIGSDSLDGISVGAASNANGFLDGAVAEIVPTNQAEPQSVIDEQEQRLSNKFGIGI